MGNAECHISYNSRHTVIPRAEVLNMHFSTAIALAALPFLVGAVPSQNSSPNAISIPLSKRRTAAGVDDATSFEANIHQTFLKFQRGFETFHNNTGHSHPLAPKQGQLAKRRVGEVPLTDLESGSMWSVEIEVGTPAKNFSVDFDTGTADTFLPGPSCPTCRGRLFYDPSKSGTSKNLEKKFNIEYEVGAVRGNLFSDKVCVGGLEATNQTLGAASEFAPSLSSYAFEADGFLGMGFKELSNFNADPFFTTLVDEHQIQEPIFGVVLAGSNSELILGGRDTRRFNGNLIYVPIDTPAFWQTTLDRITVDGNDIQALNKHVIIDTSTSLILGDCIDIGRIYDYIPGSARLANSTSLWTLPCNTNTVIKIGFGGVGFNVHPSTYVLDPISNGSRHCLGGFAEAPHLATFWTIGDVFLQNVYTEFDAGKLRVGFAPLA